MLWGSSVITGERLRQLQHTQAHAFKDLRSPAAPLAGAAPTPGRAAGLAAAAAAAALEGTTAAPAAEAQPESVSTSAPAEVARGWPGRLEHPPPAPVAGSGLQEGAAQAAREPRRCRPPPCCSGYLSGCSLHQCRYPAQARGSVPPPQAGGQKSTAASPGLA
ncbi:unnamed protein product [Prorocentrum cordatum]|uniref:Uncharacterized protein n=1 Tax=Prorocentrum cordatum TaxID=2364126 RepID=A0ABN9WT88_9DINO|nr:unnamed protein product [Polarella glacialis]